MLRDDPSLMLFRSFDATKNVLNHKSAYYGVQQYI